MKELLTSIVPPCQSRARAAASLGETTSSLGGTVEPALALNSWVAM